LKISEFSVEIKDIALQAWTGP